MSQQTQLSFKCPKCQAKSKVQVYTSVDVTLEPKLRQQVIDKKLNHVGCSKCDFATNHASSLLYQDHQNDFMVQLASDAQFKESEADKALGDVEDESLEQLQTRRVRSYEELIEKIYLLEAGLDDRVVEVLKQQLQDQEPDLKVAPIAFAAKKGEELEFFTRTEKGLGRFQVPVAAYASLREALLGLGLSAKQESPWLVVDAAYAEAVMKRLDPPQAGNA
jgi:hypothetical protein